jgi:GNAT superfamily N-acetyltransferase
MADPARDMGADTRLRGLSFRSHYWDDRPARDAFKRFLVRVFGLDLSLWEREGFWDRERYAPFSLFDGDQITASVCLYSLDMVIGGRRCRVGQFSGVGTLPPYRRHGLARWLTERALEWAAPSHAGFFLFATDEAVPFYARCGFVPVREGAPTVAMDEPRTKLPSGAGARSAPRRLDPANPRDVALVYRFASEREPVSDVLGVLDANLLMFHFLYGLRDCAYHAPALDAVLFLRREGRRVTLFDVVARRVPPLSELCDCLPAHPNRELLFQFETDKLSIETFSRTPLPGNNAHVHPTLEMPLAGCVFPYVCRA